jgi:chorismate mutase/prephenate dehydratase
MSIEDWREEIDVIDGELVRLLNARLRIAIKIGTLKQAAGLALSDQEREHQVLNHLQLLNEGPLDDETIVRIFRLIIHESRRVQQQAVEAGLPARLQEASS